jgi:hypothetical protein
MEIEAEKYSLYYMNFIQSVQLLFRHRNRGEDSVLFSGSFGMFPGCRTTFIALFWAKTVHTNF